jgi:hypothetical protein
MLGISMVLVVLLAMALPSQAAKKTGIVPGISTKGTALQQSFPERIEAEDFVQIEDDFNHTNHSWTNHEEIHAEGQKLQASEGKDRLEIHPQSCLKEVTASTQFDSEIDEGKVATDVGVSSGQVMIVVSSTTMKPDKWTWATTFSDYIVENKLTNKVVIVWGDLDKEKLVGRTHAQVRQNLFEHPGVTDKGAYPVVFKFDADTKKLEVMDLGGTKSPADLFAQLTAPPPTLEKELVPGCDATCSGATSCARQVCWCCASCKGTLMQKQQQSGRPPKNMIYAQVMKICQSIPRLKRLWDR